jgi:two-component system, chemotaxis family, chemotaxis protein CheY
VRILIVEDDYSSRFLMQELLEPHGVCHSVVNGTEGIEAFKRAIEQDQPYDLICLDIMMPEKSGHEVLQAVRAMEQERGIFLGDGAKVIMTTALGDAKSILAAFNAQCESYLVKPITKQKLEEQMRKLGLIGESD